MPQSAQNFHATTEQADQALTTALRAWLPGKSWSDVKNLVRNRQVQVDGNLCLDEGRRLRGTEVVKLLGHSAAAPPQEHDVKLRFVDAHLVVVEKPSGMTTLRHPTERSWPARRKQVQPTLDEVLPRVLAKKERGGSKKSQRGPVRRLRPVHRLDRETSGLMVFARTVDAERILGLQFKEHTIHRVYVAVALGRVTARTIESRLIDDRGDGRRGSTRNSKLGKVAITHVKPLEFINGYTLLECQLETGRTHQIRIHLSEAGYPLCGDKVYRGRYPGKPIADESGAPRLALHAAELGIEHPVSGESQKFAMPLPADLADFVARLRKK
jgi:23S rRNA pseudouridine1911/1915/1917 synthase